MPSLGLSTTKGGGLTSSYIKDGLKLYMPYNSPKEVQFVGEGSTYFLTNDYIDCGDDTSLDITSAITISMWIKPDAVNDQVNPVGRDDGTNRNYYMYLDSGDAKVYWIVFIGGYGKETVSTTLMVAGEWMHVCGTYDGARQKLYINGVLEDDDAETGSIDNDDVSFTIGAREAGADRHFDGSMKNVAVWNRGLSATEVQNIMYKSYTDLSGTLSSGLVSWWALESSTDTYADSTGTNDGTNDGSTVTTSLYGGHTPLIPRGFDNAPTVQADAIGTGFANFVASSSNYINIADSDNLSFGDASEDSAFSISAWVKMTDATSFMIFNKGTVTSHHEYLFYCTSSDKIAFYAFDESTDGYVGRTYNTALTSYENTWIHLAGTYDATEANSGFKIYLNGIQIDDTNFTGGSYTAMESLAGDVYIGRYGSSYADGKIKNVGVWSAVLTQAQIQSIMEKTYSELIASEKTTLVSWWGLDTNANDEHGSNNGTLT